MKVRFEGGRRRLSLDVSSETFAENAKSSFVTSLVIRAPIEVVKIDQSAIYISASRVFAGELSVFLPRIFEFDKKLANEAV
jgi:hypothetical protein